MTATAAVLNSATHVYTGSDGKVLPLSVSAVLRLSGIAPEYPETLAMQYARDLGWAVHDWCAWIDSGEIVNEAIESLPDELAGYVLAYSKFRTDFRPQWEHIEESFFREDCGGTPDRVGTIKPKDGPKIKVIADLKTPKKLSRHWQMQLSGYLWLLNEGETRSLLVIQLDKDGNYHAEFCAPDLQTWGAAIRVARWKQELIP